MLTRSLRLVLPCFVSWRIGFTYGSTSSNWARIRQWATDNDKLFIASVGPGYDDVPVRVP